MGHIVHFAGYIDQQETVEYDIARVKFGSRSFDKFGEINKKVSSERESAVHRLLRYARSLDW